jgi:hypothetical protein
MRPYLQKNPSQKRAGAVAQGVDPEFKPKYCNKTKQNPKTPKNSGLVEWPKW